MYYIFYRFCRNIAVHTHTHSRCIVLYYPHVPLEGNVRHSVIIRITAGNNNYAHYVRFEFINEILSAHSIACTVYVRNNYTFSAKSREKQEEKIRFV